VFEYLPKKQKQNVSQKTEFSKNSFLTMDIFYFMQNAASLQGGIWKFFRKNGSNLFFFVYQTVCRNCLPDERRFQNRNVLKN